MSPLKYTFFLCNSVCRKFVFQPAKFKAKEYKKIYIWPCATVGFFRAINPVRSCIVLSTVACLGHCYLAEESPLESITLGGCDKFRDHITTILAEETLDLQAWIGFILDVAILKSDQMKMPLRMILFAQPFGYSLRRVTFCRLKITLCVSI